MYAGITGSLPKISGTLKWFNRPKGYGFILPDDGALDVIVYEKCFDQGGFKIPRDGAKIVCETVAKGPKPQCFRILSIVEPVGIPASELQPAKVKWFNPQKGYGFLTRGPETKDILVHVDVLNHYGIGPLQPGQNILVRFESGRHGLKAIEVKLPHKRVVATGR